MDAPMEIARARSASAARVRLGARLRGDGVRYALGLALAMRLALSALAAWLLALYTPRETLLIRAQFLGQTPLHDRILGPWQRFDAFWYLRLAAHGYGAHDGSTAFYPLYPLLIKLAAFPLGGSAMLAALMVSNACFAGLLVALYRLVAARHGAGAARRAVLLLCLFPTASFLLGAYTESLFLVLTVGCFLAVERERPLLAGVLAFLAALTRLQGVVLVLPLLCVATEHRWKEKGEGSRRALLSPLALRLRQALGGTSLLTRAPHHSSLTTRHSSLTTRHSSLTWLLAAALPGLGALAFLLYVRLVVHGGFITSTFKQHWNMGVNPPWVTLAGFWSALAAHHWRIFAYPTGNWVDLLNLGLALGVLALVVPARRVLGTPLWLYSLATWLVTLTLHQSTARYMLTVFPALIALAVWAPGRRTSRLALLLGAPLMLFVAGEFVLWSFVG